MITTKNIQIAAAKTEGSVVQAIKAWAADYPHELVIFKKQMAEHRWESVSEKGDTKGDLMREVGQFPASLDKYMRLHCGRMWQRDPKVVRYFWQHFRVGRFHATYYLGVSKV